MSRASRSERMMRPGSTFDLARDLPVGEGNDYAKHRPSRSSSSAEEDFQLFRAIERLSRRGGSQLSQESRLRLKGAWYASGQRMFDALDGLNIQLRM